ncbi:uncharacterized protein V1510DRAFT_446602 [Dipodascopsis tothii]|uniref:uncharacterized protein n=1 Tax=Dipodascopsis tothii TaxID=44089 RepID=UPI0034CD3ABD
MSKQDKQEAGSAVPAQQKGPWMTFLKSLASCKGDLSSITAPPFILSATSLTEYSQFWAEHPSLFIAPAKEADAEKRAVAVLRWFIATLRGQYTSRNEKLGSEKKPLNPFLGEIFCGKWESEEIGKTVLVSEQVSHHPPVTAYSIYNDKFGIELQGYNGQKASISTATINVRQLGHAILYIREYDEYHFISLPALHIEGLFYGAPYVELEQSITIESTSGYRSIVDFSGKGYFSGKKNTFKAKLFKEGKKPKKQAAAEAASKVLYTVTGQWSDKSSIREEATKKETPFWEALEHPREQLIVKPLDEQAEYESRRAWSKVAEGVEVIDYEKIHIEKSKIENEQRALRKLEKEQGRVWVRRYFRYVEADEVYLALARRSGVPADETVWRFEKDTWEASKDSAL